VWVVVLAVVVLGACGGSRGRSVAPASTVPPWPDPHGTAVITTADLMRRVVVPAGATPYTGVLPARLRAPFESEGTPNLVDEQRAWIVPEPSARVLAFVRAHPPGGLTVAACCGSASGPTGRVDAVTFGAPTASSATGPIANAQVLVSVSARTATTTWVRADAQAVWRARRDPATLVPVTDLVITVGHSVIDEMTDVARLVRELDALPVAVPTVSHGLCTQKTQMRVTIEFRRTSDAAADVSVKTTCNHLEVNERGHHQELDPGTFVDDALRATKA
jgi:hypothetical protein